MVPHITRIKADFQRPVELAALQPSMKGTRRSPQTSWAEIVRNRRARASDGGHDPTLYDFLWLGREEAPAEAALKPPSSPTVAVPL